jgi:hypothetical protein
MWLWGSIFRRERNSLLNKMKSPRFIHMYKLFTLNDESSLMPINFRDSVMLQPIQLDIIQAFSWISGQFVSKCLVQVWLLSLVMMASTILFSSSVSREIRSMHISLRQCINISIVRNTR